MKTYAVLATGAGIKAAADYAKTLSPDTLGFLKVGAYDLRPTVAAVAAAYIGLKFGGGKAGIVNAALLGAGVQFGSDWVSTLSAVASLGKVGQYAIAAALAWVIAKYLVKGPAAPSGDIVPGV